MGGSLKLKFANHFIIYQKRPFKGRFGTGRLHSELWDWGVKPLGLSSDDEMLVYFLISIIFL